MTEPNRPLQIVEYVRSGTGSKSIPLVTHDLIISVAVCYVWLRLLYGSCTFRPGMPGFLTVAYGKLMFMVAVSSRFITELPQCATIRFICSSATVGHGARGGRRSMVEKLHSSACVRA